MTTEITQNLTPGRPVADDLGRGPRPLGLSTAEHLPDRSLNRRTITPLSDLDERQQQDAYVRGHLADAEVSPDRERPALSKPASKGRRKALAGHLPRRFTDHRRVKARQYRDLFETVVEQYRPTSKLGFWLAALTADLMNDYQTLRASKKKATRAQRRKLIGLLYGALRETRNASGHAGADDLSLELSKLMGTK